MTVNPRPAGDKVTDLHIKHALPESSPYKIACGGGLLCQVMPNGSKRWRLKYRFGGKEKLLSLGSYPQISLKQARIDRDGHKATLRSGVDPSTSRKEQKQKAELVANQSFEAVSLAWLKIQKQKIVPAHYDRQLRRLEKYLFPKLGNRPIDQITNHELLAVLQKIAETGKIETAHRVRVIASQIYRHALFLNLCQRNMANDLADKLPTTPEKHHPAVTDPALVGEVLRKIETYRGDTVTNAALKLSALTMLRPGELRHLKWENLNNTDQQLELTASKVHTDHIVPLPVQAMSLLEELRPLTERTGWIFPGRDREKPISENTVNQALKRLGYKDVMTPHGFRAMARTMLDERLGVRPDFIEHQLAHTVRDPLGRAYNRATHLAERRKMLQQWADYLDELKGEGK